MFSFKNRINSIVSNKKGLAPLAVMAFMIVSSTVGSGLMFISQKDAESQGAYHHMRGAEMSSESGLNLLMNMLEYYQDETEYLMNNFNNDVSVWYNGDGNEWNWSSVSYEKIHLSENSAATIEIFEVDPERMVLKTRVIGLGMDESRRTLNAIIEISGVTTHTQIIQGSGTAIQHALFVASEMQNVNPSLIVNGDFYSGGKAIFNKGSKIHGNTTVINDENHSIISDDVEFNGNTYFRGDVTFNNQLTVGDQGDYFFVGGNATINDDVVFNTNAVFKGGFQNLNAGITFNEYGFMGGVDFRVPNAGIESSGDVLDIYAEIKNFNRIITKEGGTVRFKYDDYTDHDNLILESGATAEYAPEMTVPTEEDWGIDKNRREEVTAITDHLTVNFSLSDFDAQASSNNFYGNSVRNSFPASFFEQLSRDGQAGLHGENFSMNGSTADNNGFLVVKVDRDISNFEYANFNEKVIFVVEDATINAGNSFWNIQEDGNVGMIVKSSGTLNNFGGPGTFRGVVWDSSSNRGNYSTFGGGSHGSYIIKGDEKFNINKGVVDYQEITFDAEKLSEFAGAGVFADPTTGSTGFVPSFSVETKLRSRTLKPKILTKY